ncbi:MAG: DEAD/DEAH box helicase family protein [Mycobacteriales bacterium]
MHDAWDRCAFPGTLRRYQAQALDVAEQLRAAGRSSACLVLPPGAGKTVLGLEAARRIGRRTMVLTPNTAVQAQWLAQWKAFGGDGPHPCPGSAEPALTAPLSVLTYQSLTAWDRTADDEDVEDDSSASLAETRRAALHGEEGSDLLDLLHPRGRDLVRRAATSGPWTLVLDEGHHLLETWGDLCRALVRALGEDTWVLGLTATPHTSMTARQGELHDDLFGDRDFVVPAPAAVKEGELAPYQELVYLTAPTAEEEARVVGERQRFADLRLELLSLRTGSLPFLDWLWRRLHDRRLQRDAPRLTWSELAEVEPELARAGLRLVQSGVLELPVGARLREEHRVAADARDWAVLLGAYAREHLSRTSSPEDARLLESIRAVLPSLGFVLTGRGLRTSTSLVDRICALSAAKAAAALHILDAEFQALGEDLHAVVLCDVEQRPAQAPASPQEAPRERPAGSARLSFLALANSELGPALRPVLVTGRTVAMRRADLAGFRAFAPAALADRLLADPLDGNRSLVTLSAGVGWSARVWTALMTRWLEAGGTHVLVGTRGLLGEGWDCPALDVVVDLTTAATPTAVTQLRGRSLRLDPQRPDKVADNWTVVCVSDEHPRGDADYLRAVRKHEHHFAPGRDGVVESGIGHCDDALGPYAPPDPQTRVAVNDRALVRTANRDAVRVAWAVGAGYRGIEVATLRVRAQRSLGLPGGVVPAPLLVVRQTLGAPAPAPLPDPHRPTRLWPLPTATAVPAGVSVGLAEGPATGMTAAAGTGALVTAAVGGRRYARQLRALQPVADGGQTATLRQLAHAVGDALHAIGATSVGAAAVRVTGGPGGDVACELDAPTADSLLFATCLEELLAPLADPRWLVSRLVLPVPAAAADRHRLARARALGRPVEAAVAWHAVPTAFGRSRKGIAAFEAAWWAHVGAGRLVLAKDAEGFALLDLLRGEDPFTLTSRLRTVWR